MPEIRIPVDGIWKYWQRELEGHIIRLGSISDKGEISYEGWMSWKVWKSQVALLDGMWCFWLAARI